MVGGRALAFLGGLAACQAAPPPDRPPEEALPGVQVRFDLGAAATGGEAFFDAPYPMDLRLTEAGTPPLTQLPRVMELPLLAPVAEQAETRAGFPQMSVGWFRFDGALAERDEPMLDPDVLVLPLVDGAEPLPAVSQVLRQDDHLPAELLAVAPAPGLVLAPQTEHAYVVLRSRGDAEGEPLGAPFLVWGPLLGEGAVSEPPAWAGPAARLGAHLGALGLTPRDVAAWTTFTTGDSPGALHGLSEAVREAHAPRLEGLTVLTPSYDLPGYCAVEGTLTLPQFQRGEAPFNTEGTFELEGGVPVVQREEEIPVVVTFPDAAMPAAGFPLAMYFHGSGGRSDQLITRGRVDSDGDQARGEGPAWVLAQAGFATAGSAHPINPERVEGASSFAYLNFQNFTVFPDTFRQGVIEQRLYLDALLALELDPELVAEGCPELEVPEGETVHFDPNSVVAMGQSMGGMYANMVGAVDPRLTAVVPTGAGGHWTRFILETSLGGEGLFRGLLSVAIGVDDEDLTWMHPALHTVQTAWEPAEPYVYASRLARRPLEGHPVRDVYQPVGLGDVYFPPVIFDGMALASGNAQAGSVVWESLQDSLSLVGAGRRAAVPRERQRRGRHRGLDERRRPVPGRRDPERPPHLHPASRRAAPVPVLLRDTPRGRSRCARGWHGRRGVWAPLGPRHRPSLGRSFPAISPAGLGRVEVLGHGQRPPRGDGGTEGLVHRGRDEGVERGVEVVEQAKGGRAILGGEVGLRGGQRPHPVVGTEARLGVEEGAQALEVAREEVALGPGPRRRLDLERAAQLPGGHRVGGLRRGAGPREGWGGGAGRTERPDVPRWTGRKTQRPSPSRSAPS